MRKLSADTDGMFVILGECLVRFIKAKEAPFGKAMRSQHHFWQVPGWKRALIFVFFLRIVLNKTASKSWDNYDWEDYKFAVRTFRRYLQVDHQIIDESTTFQQLPEDLQERTPPRKRRRKATYAFAPTSESCSEAPLTICLVESASSSDDDEE